MAPDLNKARPVIVGKLARVNSRRYSRNVGVKVHLRTFNIYGLLHTITSARRGSVVLWEFFSDDQSGGSKLLCICRSSL